MKHLLFPLTTLILLASCGGLTTPAFHVYTPDQVDKIVDNGFRIERIGEPSETRTDLDSAVLVTTTRVYQVFVALDDKGQIIEQPDSAVMARQATGPIIITTSCDMMCTPVRPGEPCNVTGCQETTKCGCSQGSCGNNCTTDVACHMSRSGVGSGRLIIF